MVNTVYLDDFEDGDINIELTNWSGWSGDTSVFSASTNAAHAGSYSGFMNDGLRDQVEIVRDTDRPNSEMVEIRFAVRVESKGDDASDQVRIEWGEVGGTTEWIQFFSDGTIDADGTQLTSSWSTNTWYHFTVDYANGQIINDTTGDSVAYDPPYNFGRVELYADYGFSSEQTVDTYIDEIEYDWQSPPSAPSNLSATQGTEDQIDLSWTDNSSNEDGFYVYRAQSTGSSKSDYSQVADLAANTTAYTDGSLEDGEKYFYRVSSYNAAGESSLSNEDNAITVLPTTNPSLDTSVEDEITISWTKQDDSSDGNWEIYKSEDGTLGTEITAGLTPSTSSYTDGSLEDGEKFYYTLRRNTDHTSADGTQKSGITVLPGASAVSLDASVEDEITVSWTRNDDTGDGEWEVYASTDGTLGTLVGDALTPTTTSFTHTGLNDGEKYYYTIRRASDHTSTDSSQPSAVTVLPAPTNLSADTVRDTEADLSWIDNHDYGDTRVEYKRTSATAWTTFSTLARNTEAETLTGLLNGEQYDARVVAQTEHTETVDA